MVTIYDTTEKFFTQTLGYDVKSWKAAKTRAFNKLGIPATTSLTKTIQFKLLCNIAYNNSIKKHIALEILDKHFTGFVEDKSEDILSEIIIKFATQYNVDPYELATQYKIIKRDMIEKGINPNYKLRIYKFPHTIKLTKIVLEIFIFEGIPITGNVPQKEIETKIEPIVKPKRKYTKKVKPLEVTND